MSARQNYGFERRRRADLQRAKQEAKRQRKTERDAAEVSGPEMGEVQEAGPPPGTWEWFSPSRTRTVTTAAGNRPPAEEANDWILLTDVPPDQIPQS